MTHCRWRVWNTPFSWAGVVILEDHIFAESVEWEEWTNFFFLYHCGKWEQIQSHILNILKLKPFQLCPLRDLSFSQVGSRKWNINQDQAHQISIPVYKKIGNSACIYSKRYSHFCIPKSVSKARGAEMGRLTSSEQLGFFQLCARDLARYYVV